MIADPDRYEPRAGDTMLDFARHYGTSFLPARVYRPLDKTKGGSCGPSRRARFMRDIIDASMPPYFERHI